MHLGSGEGGPGSWTIGRQRKTLTRLGRPQRALRPGGVIGLSPKIPGKLFSCLAEVWVGWGAQWTLSRCASS